MKATTWYQIGFRINEIKPVQVVKETSQYVHYISPFRTVPIRAQKRARDGYGFYETWEEARSALITRALRKLDQGRKILAAREADYRTALQIPQEEPSG
jgi:hypothetical protein